MLFVLGPGRGLSCGSGVAMDYVEFFASRATSAFRIPVRVGVKLCVVEGSVQD